MSRSATIALIRHLAAHAIIAPRKRVGKWPRPVQPTAIEMEYHTALVREVCRPAREAFERELPAILHALREHRRALGHMDAASPAHVVAGAARHFAALFDPVMLKGVVHRFGTVTDRHSRLQLDQQLRTAIGVPLSLIEKPATDQIDGWAALNVDLIKTIPERYFDRLRLHIVDAFEGGTHPNTLAEQLAEDYDISDRDAERIARDQVLSLNADLTHERMAGLGVTRGIWKTMNDNRVCDICLPREGQEFELSTGIDGELPGDCHPMDRCYTEPDLDALING